MSLRPGSPIGAAPKHAAGLETHAQGTARHHAASLRRRAGACVGMGPSLQACRSLRPVAWQGCQRGGESHAPGRSSASGTDSSGVCAEARPVGARVDADGPPRKSAAPVGIGAQRQRCVRATHTMVSRSQLEPGQCCPARCARRGRGDASSTKCWIADDGQTRRRGAKAVVVRTRAWLPRSLRCRIRRVPLVWQLAAFEQHVGAWTIRGSPTLPKSCPSGALSRAGPTDAAASGIYDFSPWVSGASH